MSAYTCGHKSLTSPRMADSRLLLPLPVLPQTPKVVPYKAKEDRVPLEQHKPSHSHREGLWLNTPPQSPSDEQKLNAPTSKEGSCMEIIERNSWIGDPFRQETQISDLHPFYSMILGTSLSLSVPQFLHV